MMSTVLSASPDRAVAAQDSARLPRSTLFFYGLTEIPIQVSSLAITAFIPNYYGSDLGVSLATVGAVWMAARLFDAVTDPLIGYLSDRTRSRWGRRRIWMLASVPILMLSVYKVFFPTPGVGGGYLLGWMVMLWLGWTMLLIPYYAWATELSSDYNERSVISGWRTALGLAGNVVSKLIPVVALLLFAYGGTREVLVMIGTMLLILTPLTVFLTVARVPERTDITPVSIPILKGLRIMWRNGPFKRLLLAFFINNVGLALSSAVLLFYIRGVLGEERAGIVALLGYYVVNLCTIPFWVWLSKRIDKHRAWCAGLMVYWVSVVYLFMGPGDFYLMAPIMAINGFGAASAWVMPNSMKADVIDLDTLKSGENRAAWFFAVWSLAIKIAASIGPALALMLVALTGFDPTPGAVNTAGELLGVKLIFALAVPAFYTLAAAVAFNYPITQARHARMRAALERREARRSRSAQRFTYDDWK